jgi:hypothetical protein
MADMTTRRAVDAVEWEKGYANALTSTVVNVVKMPMVLENDELAIKAAIKTSNVFDMKQARVVRIHNTLHIREIWISESLLPDALRNEQIEILSDPEDIKLTK